MTFRMGLVMLFFSVLGSFQLFFSLSLSTALCRYNGFTLIKRVFPGARILCSSKIENITRLSQLLDIISRDNVIGIYKRNESAAQLCYWKEVETGLINLASLSGGNIQTLGKFISNCYTVFLDKDISVRCLMLRNILLWSNMKPYRSLTHNNFKCASSYHISCYSI